MGSDHYCIEINISKQLYKETNTIGRCNIKKSTGRFKNLSEYFLTKTEPNGKQPYQKFPEKLCEATN
jgi:hypothetical protein